MIVRMKHLDLVCLSSERDSALAKLRDLGAVHLDLALAHGGNVESARADQAAAEKAVQLVLKARDDASRDEFDVRPRKVGEILSLAEDQATLADEIDRLIREIARVEPYGDFDLNLASEISGRLPDLGNYVELPDPLPEMRLSKMREKLARVQNRWRIDNAKIASSDETAILSKYPQLADRIAFEAARTLMGEQGELSFVSGWVPVTLLENVRSAASTCGWAILARDPIAGEEPPTLVEPPRMFRPMKALFAGLGIAPGYEEADVSVPFMAYFSLFFAMLVGDGAYGAIFFFATLFFRRRMPKSWFVLLSVFSLATIAWGALSNTWFGAGLPFAREWPSVKWLADPSYHNMMLLCFTIGVSHLMLARIWNGVCRLNSFDCLPEFGWAGILLFMYLVTNSVVGIFPGIPEWGFWLLGGSFLLIVSRTRGPSLGMLPLNIMGSLGDIISYVRLFAVGLASVKVAENFNMMATGLMDGDGQAWWLKGILAVSMALILLVGHALNLAMAGLSILVHAVRLNTLEFSNHKGITWSGYAFRAFKKH